MSFRQVADIAGRLIALMLAVLVVALPSAARVDLAFPSSARRSGAPFACDHCSPRRAYQGEHVVCQMVRFSETKGNGACNETPNTTSPTN